MAIHKLFIDDFEEADYQLIAIHTTLENYRVAYFINQNLPILLHRNKKEILIGTEKQKKGFSNFHFEDNKKEIFWTLIENKREISLPQKNKIITLFKEEQEFSNTIYFLPEFKNVDFFLKIEGDESQININKIITKLNTIDQIATVYAVDKSRIKSKNNLIF
ncbi:IPExxxVDY family protein [Flavobacterium azooxidireducens]|uniref:IPExxxVDY family protein n=1 Tax=Flavobacterium azooxidireducens TaxID=1871076 RepID=A0ABY4KM78_9FLAO|nr:IPExxxVDY family protein [Flavobacterium azooxidireducens]UPQ80332.1 IPExxxVDY family protein [Flavobacterium azooxidireducens]